MADDKTSSGKTEDAVFRIFIKADIQRLSEAEWAALRDWMIERDVKIEPFEPASLRPGWSSRCWRACWTT